MRGLRLFECAQLMAPALVGVACCAPAAGPRDPVVLASLAALFFHLLFTYTYNDYAERDRDLANVRKRAAAAASRTFLGWVAAGAFAACLAAMALLPLRLQVLFALFQIAGILYSHPRALFKGRAPLGEALHLFTGAGYFLAGCWVRDLHAGPEAIWGALAFAAIYTSGSCLGQLRDREADRLAGLRTLAVVAGRRPTLALGLLLQATGLAALAALAPGRPAAVLVAILLIAHLAGVALAARSGAPLDQVPGFQRRYRVLFGLAVAVVVIAAIAAPGRRIDAAIEAGLRSLARTQEPDGSWPYSRSRRADFAAPVDVPARVFATMHVLMTLHDTPGATGAMAGRARHYLVDQAEEGPVWAVDGRSHTLGMMVGSEPCFIEPDAETTALGNLLLAGDLGLEKADAERVRDLLERYRLPSGLYGTYLHEYHGARGCPGYDHMDRASLGSNLHVLAWLEARGLDATRLVGGIADEMTADRYWERAVYYRSLPILAHLASNAVEHGARSAIPILERLLADFDRAGVPPADLSAAELAALVNARGHLCRLRGGGCPTPRDAAEAEMLLDRQDDDGGWPAASIYVADLTRDDFERLIYPGVREAMRAQTGNPPTLEQALASATLGPLHYGSRAESTALAVKALVRHRRAGRDGDPE